MSSFNGNKDKKLDSFWTLDNIVPKIQKKYSSPTKSTDTVEISFGEAREDDSSHEPSIPSADAAKGDDTVIKRFIPPFSSDEIKSAEGEYDEYSPSGMLIKSVRVYNWKSNYNYYAQFRADAERLYKYKGSEVPRQKFFSYVPQYSQMTKEQLLWYIWWRTNFRNNVVLETDYSYILLYIFEIINLDDKIDTMFGLSQLVSVWIGYREEYPQLDRFLGDWICDYAFIHHLSADLLPDIPTDAVKTATLKEFFISGAHDSDALVEAILAFATNYDYHKSKFSAGENRKLYDKHIRGVIGALTKDYFSTGTLALGTAFEISKIKRDSYVGAVSCHQVKKKLEIEFFSFSHSHEVRYVVTDVIKYAENKLRAHLGVKSRLGVYALSAEIREIIDKYFAENLTEVRATRKTEIPVYEKLYDLPKSELSPENAKEIEARSWSTTKVLVEAFEEDSADAQPAIDPEPKEELLKLDVSKNTESDDMYDLELVPVSENNTSDSGAYDGDAGAFRTKLGTLYPFIALALSRDYVAQRRFAAEHGMILDSLADKVNEASLDIIGDILLADSGDGYEVIEDYKEIFT